MSVMTALAVGSSIASTASSMFGASKSAKQQKKIAKLQSKFTYAQRMEEIRRAAREQAFVEGTALASSYASGLQMTGTTKNYIADLKSEHRYQLAQADAQARLEKKLIKEGGQSPGLNAQLIGQAASGLASAVGTYRAMTG